MDARQTASRGRRAALPNRRRRRRGDCRPRGGGALPLAEPPSFACAVEESLAAPLRTGEPPVVGVVRDGKLLLDCLTLTDAEVEIVADAVARARG